MLDISHFISLFYFSSNLRADAPSFLSVFTFPLFYLHNAVSDTAVSDTNNSIIIKQAQGNAYFPQLN